MTRYLLFACLIALAACNAPQEPAQTPTPAEQETPETVAATTEDATPKFDAELAKRLEADPYGMHQFVIAFLYAGNNRETDSTKAAELQMAHMANIDRLAEEGKLVLAGPFLDNGDLRGLYVFDVKTVEEAEALTATDPAIQSGSLRMELHPWYGSAAVMDINNVHNRIQEKSF